MKVTTERIPEAQLVLEVEIDDERVNKSLEQAAKRLAQRYRIPGFRKGRAPRAIVEQTLGADAVFEEAIDRMIPQAYEQAIKDEGLEPIGPPEVESVDRDPVRFRARVPMQPEIDLGPYDEIAQLADPVAITDEDVANAILEVQRQHAVLEPVERPVELNDRLKADIQAVIDGKTVLDETDAEFHVREEMILGVPGVGEALIGLEPGEHSFSIDAPDDWEDADVAGKTVAFTITIKEVKKEILPDADDDLAAEVGEFESFEAMRERLHEDLRNGAEQRASQAHSTALMDAVLAGATIEFPPMLAQHEVEHMLQELARQTGQDPQAILDSAGASAQQLRENLRGEAVERVRRSLILEKLAEAESIAISPDEVDAELDRMGGDGPQAEQVRAMFDNENGRAMLQRNLLNARIMDRLSDIAKANALTDAGEAPPDDPSDDDTDDPRDADADASPNPAADNSDSETADTPPEDQASADSAAPAAE